MMTQITVDDLNAQHVGYIVSTRKATGMLQCILHFEEEEDTVGLIFAGHPHTVLLAPDDPAVISGLQDLAVDPAEVQVLSADFADDSVEGIMSTYSGITVKFRAIDNETGAELKVDTNRDKIEGFIANNEGTHLQRLIWVNKGMAQDWTDVQ
jgi:hypothetical protein